MVIIIVNCVFCRYRYSPDNIDNNPVRYKFWTVFLFYLYFENVCWILETHMNIDFMLFPSLVFHRYINTIAAICNPNIAIVFYNSRLLEVHAHTESCRAARFINGGRGNACYSFSSFFFSFLFVSLITFVMLLMISFGWFWLWNAYYNVCVSALLTGSPDCSILATDVETGSTIARLDNAHEWVDLLLWLTCHDLAYRFMCVFIAS